MNDDDGMRILRGKPKKYPAVPRHLLETAPGAIVLIAVRVAAHFGGPGGGDHSDVLCRPYDLASGQELYRSGDLYIPRAELVAVYDREAVKR